MEEDGKETISIRESKRRERQAALESPDIGIGLCGWIIVGLSILLMLATLPLSIWMCIKIVKEYERAIIFRLGRILRGRAKGPGLFFILPCTDNFINVDMRTITFDIPPQEVLTKDSVTVSVDGVVYYRVQNATLAVANITNADAATRLLAQTTLRNVLGTKNLAEILSDREEIAHSMQGTRKQRLPWTTLQMTGVSRWSGWRSRTSNCPSSSRGPWLQRPRLAVRPGQR
ncbi:stomatin-like isoform X2 [Oncorhynchus keta]|uniref:stomatin-like isoform X2 n=1 Tax=Oncorhynchus keta TaxID=8018 RepID=UPI0015F86732|nr:stomatin-like isoform X2 [Oncorhynchus keta]XP_046224148.1 stomatin-like isoform X2 [Oncorhynchus gorbuscha]